MATLCKIKLVSHATSLGDKYYRGIFPEFIHLNQDFQDFTLYHRNMQANAIRPYTKWEKLSVD